MVVSGFETQKCKYTLAKRDEKLLALNGSSTYTVIGCMNNAEQQDCINEYQKAGVGAIEASEGFTQCSDIKGTETIVIFYDEENDCVHVKTIKEWIF